MTTPPGQWPPPGAPQPDDDGPAGPPPGVDPEQSAWDAHGRQWQPQPAPAEGTDGFAVASLVLGILPVMAGLLGIVFGLVARRRTARTGQAGRGMAAWGIGLGATWLAIIVALVVYAVVSEPERDENGRLTTSGDVTSEDLRAHDCVSEIPNGEVTTVGVVPCSEPHVGEVYETYQLPGASYPGDSTVTRLAEGHCLKVLRSFVGVPAGKDTGWEVSYLFPTRATWGLGDHEVACILTAPGEESTVGSAEGKGARVVQRS